MIGPQLLLYQKLRKKTKAKSTAEIPANQNPKFHQAITSHPSIAPTADQTLPFNREH
jgi:hypothetical protein